MERNAAKVLLLEDELNVGETLRDRLEQEGYFVAWAKSCEEARLELAATKFQLAVLDVGLPDGTGFEVASLIRKQSPATAILFLTAFGSPEDRVRGLELGAEDYVLKPFHLKELLLRIQNGLKRATYLSASSQEDGVRVGEAVVNFSRFEAERDGRTQTLTHKECALLRLLVQRAGHTVSREEILREIWSGDESPSTRTIDNFVLRLRRLIEVDPENPQVIKSIRGVGYQLETGSKA